VLKPGFTLPPLMFTLEEVEALALGARWVEGRADEGLRRAARGALAKIAAVLPPSGRRRSTGRRCSQAPAGRAKTRRRACP
jgi:predicted DNA-binding transcriptional regulator YafY